MDAWKYLNAVKPIYQGALEATFTLLKNKLNRKWEACIS